MPIQINEIAIRIQINQNSKDDKCGDDHSKDSSGGNTDTEMLEALAEKVFEIIQSKKDR